MAYDGLKKKHRSLRENFHPNLSLRTHRALSWLQKAEASDDVDSRFIFLWIAFNAAYANDIDQQYRATEKGMFENFFEKLISLDTNHQLYNVCWLDFSSSIRLLLDNKFIYQPFWNHQNGILNESEWQSSFELSKKRVAQGLGDENTKLVLSIVFCRIYTLRNQVIHGGSTWNSSANRTQLRDCTAILEKVIPIIIELMMDHSDTLWGDPFYPLIQE